MRVKFFAVKVSNYSQLSALSSQLSAISDQALVGVTLSLSKG